MLLNATKKLWKDKNAVVTCDKKNLLWFMVGYDFNPTCYVFSIPEHWQEKKSYQPTKHGNFYVYITCIFVKTV